LPSTLLTTTLSDLCCSRRFDEDQSGFLDSEELTLMAKQLWLPEKACASPGRDSSMDDADTEPDAVKLLLQLAAEKDDGDGEISWEEFLDLMQSLYHAPDSPSEQ
jgi:Ca2+-binding EF-hand superfamily protein